MMFKRFFWIVPVLFALAVPMAAQALPVEPAALAEQLVDQLVKQDFVAASANFDDAVKKALPPDKLAQVWKQIIDQAGPFQKRLKTTVARTGEYDGVTVTCAFEKTNLDIKVGYNSQKRVSGLFFAPAATSSLEAPNPAQPAAYREEPIELPGSGGSLPDTLTLPTGKRPFPAVVLLQGSGPADRDETVGANKPFRDLAHGLAAHQIAVLRYDRRTRVFPEQFQKSTSVTVREEVLDDARSALALLRRRTDIDSSRLFVLGHSLGGTLLPRLALEEKAVAGWIILAGSTRPLADLLIEQLTYLSSISESEAEKAQLAGLKQKAERLKDPALSPATPASELPPGAPASYWLDLRGYQPAAVAATIDKPFLILQGGRDYQVTTADFEGWKQALARRPNVRLKLYPRLNHLFIAGEGKSVPSEYLTPGHVSEEVVSDIAGWIAATR